MTAGSMVTGVRAGHTVTNIGRHRSSRYPGVTVHHWRIPMQQDTRADRSPAETAPRSVDVTDAHDGVDDPGITEELLVEEVSIDGMCGVY
jgi:mycofactocin precursor